MAYFILSWILLVSWLLLNHWAGFCHVIYSFAQPARLGPVQRVWALGTRPPGLAAWFAATAQGGCSAVGQNLWLRREARLRPGHTWVESSSGLTGTVRRSDGCEAGREVQGNRTHAVRGGDSNEILQKMAFSPRCTWQRKALTWLLHKKPCMFL